jgi:hypothetical protein
MQFVLDYSAVSGIWFAEYIDQELSRAPARHKHPGGHNTLDDLCAR